MNVTSRFLFALNAIGLISLSTALLLGQSTARADTAPPAGTPATVSADVLPTVQINGVVWAQVVVGSTVYATGDFTRARPGGAAPGTAEVTRNSLLAYDIRTGNLLPFTHSLNGAGRAIAASPDGSRLYVGGTFTTVDGKRRNRIAAFNLSDGSLAGGFTRGVDAGVRAVTATNSTVYLGGSFSRADGQARGRLAAFTRAGAVTGWKPSVDRVVSAMVMSPDRQKVVFGGSFSTVNGRRYHALAAADAVTGQPLPWASQSSTFPIRNDGTNSAITSLSADATQIYVTGYNFGEIAKPGGFEGRAAISPVDGRLIWVNDCHGDSYSAYPIGDVLYSVGHAHDCRPAGAFPEQNPRQWYRALAETVYRTHTNGPATGGYNSFQGLPASTQLAWYPTVSAGSFTGQTQGGFSIVGNSRYVAMGGEFVRVNNVPQQGLARFAIRSLAPNKRGPVRYGTAGLTAPPANSQGQITVTWKGTWDQDNAVLTYRLYRDNGTVPIHTTTADSRWWKLPSLTYRDTGLTPGATHRYRLVVSDPLGNTTTTTTPTAARDRIAGKAGAEPPIGAAPEPPS